MRIDGCSAPKIPGKNGDTSPKRGKPEANVPALIFDAAAPNDGGLSFPRQAGIGASAEHLGGLCIDAVLGRAIFKIDTDQNPFLQIDARILQVDGVGIRGLSLEVY